MKLSFHLCLMHNGCFKVKVRSKYKEKKIRLLKNNGYFLKLGGKI